LLKCNPKVPLAVNSSISKTPTSKQTPISEFTDITETDLEFTEITETELEFTDFTETELELTRESTESESITDRTFVTSSTNTISTGPNTTQPNSFCKQSCKWATVKCVFYKYKNNGSEMIFQNKEIIINNTNLCNRMDPEYQKAIIEERNKASDEKIKEIEEKTSNEIKRVNEEYKKEIIANKSFGYIAIISIAVLVFFVIIMDITKFCSFILKLRTVTTKVKPKNEKAKMVEDDSVFRKVHKLNETNLKKLKSLKN
jgi:hypothetical protein